MSIPTRGETFSKLLEHIRKAQEECAMMAHLERDIDKAHALAWLKLSEMFKLTAKNVTDLARKGLQ